MIGTNDNTVEFKIREPNKSWEDSKVRMTENMIDTHEANEFAMLLSMKHNAEVRWNWAWSSQGHYIGRKLRS